MRKGKDSIPNLAPMLIELAEKPPVSTKGLQDELVQMRVGCKNASLKLLNTASPPH